MKSVRIYVQPSIAAKKMCSFAREKREYDGLSADDVTVGMCNRL